TVAEHARARAILDEYATDSLAPFALRDDKCFHFAAGGVLAYRVLRGTAVVSGDPIGPPGCAAAVLAVFAGFAASRGWEVVMTAAAETNLTAYRRLGFQALCIGEEASVDPARFSLAGRHMKALRHSVTRQGRRGWSIDAVSGADLAAATANEIAAVERRWREDRPRLTGFSMTLGRLWGAEEDRRCVYILGRDPQRRLHAFLRFAEYRDGLSLDLMRRVGEVPNGLTDAMVVAAIELARARGLSSVSLNFAGFAHVMGPHRDLTWRGRLARRLLTASHGRFQLERLSASNQKFRPRWERRYLVYRSPRRLPVLGLRVLQAERYLRPPRTRALAARWEPGADPIRPVSATPAASSATATQVPVRVSWGTRCSDTGPEIVAASDTAPISIRIGAAIAAAIAGRIPGLMERRSRPATTPAGTQATTTRASGWAPSPASCCNGSASGTAGPSPRTRKLRKAYSQPRAATTTRQPARIAREER
ncbi:MAG TPA: phosphatidylglycerol lysyltransferase domain-containing protein, partial [Solirubrobacter sp.]|nr:phosphatidylglycerol lysyltransferase domain-containing protein [Solirubrobacter sp.]